MENYNVKSLQVQEDFVNKTQDLIKKENLMEKFNLSLAEFAKKPEFGAFNNLKKAIEEIDSFIKENVKESLKANDLKSSSGPAGSFTLASRSTVYYDKAAKEKDERVARILECEEELKKLKDDVKQDLDLLGISVPGAYLKTTEYVMFKEAAPDKKDKALIVDNVDFEVIEESK